MTNPSVHHPNDTDEANSAVHHTLGWGPGQAAPGAETKELIGTGGAKEVYVSDTTPAPTNDAIWVDTAPLAAYFWNGSSWQAFPGTPGPAGPDGPQGPQGVPGAPGSIWYTGAGVPSNSLGVPNDFYLNSTNGDYYQKISAAWSLKGNLKGPQGDQGIQGVKGDKGDKGDTGDTGPQGPPGGIGETPLHGSGTKNTTTALPLAATYQIVWDTNEPAPPGYVQLAREAGATGFIVTKPGMYLVNLSTNLAPTAGQRYQVNITKNGGNANGGNVLMGVDTGNTNQFNGNAFIECVANDVIGAKITPYSFAGSLTAATIQILGPFGGVTGPKGDKGDTGTPGTPLTPDPTLLPTRAYLSGVSVPANTTNWAYDAGGAVGCTFVAPPSGAALIQIAGFCRGNGTASSMSYDIKEGSVIGSGTVLVTGDTPQAVSFDGQVASGNVGAIMAGSLVYSILGLTPGATYNVAVKQKNLDAAALNLDFRTVIVIPVNTGQGAKGDKGDTGADVMGVVVFNGDLNDTPNSSAPDAEAAVASPTTVTGLVAGAKYRVEHESFIDATASSSAAGVGVGGLMRCYEAYTGSGSPTREIPIYVADKYSSTRVTVAVSYVFTSVSTATSLWTSIIRKTSTAGGSFKLTGQKITVTRVG